MSQAEIDDLLQSWLPTLPEPQVARVRRWLTSGIDLLTDYSGSGQAERVLHDIKTCVARCCPEADPEEFKVSCLRSCDIERHCQKVLVATGRMLGEDSCVFGDMTMRLPAMLREKLSQLVESYRARCQEQRQRDNAKKAKVISEFGELFVSEVVPILREHLPLFDLDCMQHCYTHGRQCAAYPKSPSRASGGLRINICGISCQDWSIRGNQMGILGQGAIPLLTLMWDVLGGQYDVVIAECTATFREDHLARFLQAYKDTFKEFGGFSVQAAVFSPVQLGIPCERVRKYMVVTNASSLAWAPSPSGTTVGSARFNERNLLCLFARELRTTGSVFLEATPKAQVRLEVERLAAAAHMPTRDGTGRRWPMRLVLSGGMKRLLQKHRAHLQERGIAHDAELFATIDQNPNRSSLVPVIPALLRRSAVWSYKHDRLMLATEHLAVQGIRLGSAAEEAKLTATEMKILAGNAMNHSALAAVVLFALSSLTVKA